MIKNTCWFFGDSFTRGDNCHEGDPYYELTYKKGCKRWTEIVSENLGYVEKNYGIGGNSNLNILHQLTTYLPKFKKGDCVIVGDTRPHRTIFFENGKLETAINDPAFGYEKGRDRIVIDYLFEQVVPNEDLYEKYYESMFTGISKFLNQNEINCIYWKYSDFWFPIAKMQTISQDTNGKINDSHYSWNAHKKKSSIIIEKVQGISRII